MCTCDYTHVRVSLPSNTHIGIFISFMICSTMLDVSVGRYMHVNVDQDVYTHKDRNMRVCVCV